MSTLTVTFTATAAAVMASGLVREKTTGMLVLSGGVGVGCLWGACARRITCSEALPFTD
jgi:hypothetical protein